jgi:hypothetical protein
MPDDIETELAVVKRAFHLQKSDRRLFVGPVPEDDILSQIVTHWAR